MTTFNIAVNHVVTEVYTVDAEDWQEAVEIAAEKAEEEGLNTLGGVAVYDSAMEPVDTWKDWV